MVRIIVVVILLSIFLAINAGIIHKPSSPQAHSVTRLEKRSSMLPQSKKIRKNKKTPRFNCNKATYKTITLYDFVYTHNCFPTGWEQFLENQNVNNAINELSENLDKKAKDETIEPPMRDMFNAFKVSTGVVLGRDAVKVVILGQDPVPEPNKATGLAFSLKYGKDPLDKVHGVPTVLNMLVELKLEGMNVDLSNGDLTPWVNRGVLLLNAALTVRQGSSNKMAKSHQDIWETFTDLVVKHISDNVQHTAWILWGKKAKAFASKIDTTNGNHFIKAGGHPSTNGKAPGIRFYGRNYFKCANEYLAGPNVNRGAVDWSLPHRSTSKRKQLEKCSEKGLVL